MDRKLAIILEKPKIMIGRSREIRSLKAVRKARRMVEQDRMELINIRRKTFLCVFRFSWKIRSYWEVAYITFYLSAKRKRR